jgi:hypothetical protein
LLFVEKKVSDVENRLIKGMHAMEEGAGNIDVLTV